MKRSTQIKLVLIGGLYSGVFTACVPLDADREVSGVRVYPNDYHVPQLGYYHAPYRTWYPLPYNHRDVKTNLYYHGGLWTPEPHVSIVNLSEPTPAALQALANSTRAIRRGGFGSSYGGHYFSS